jgi:hypothetical protein
MLRLICAMALVAQGVSGCGDSTDPNGTGGTGGMMFEPGPTCIALCAKVIGSCEAFSFTEATCRQGCEADLASAAETSEACETALDLGFQCVTALDCEEVYDWRDRVPEDDYPCRAASVLVEANCSS